MFIQCENVWRYQLTYLKDGIISRAHLLPGNSALVAKAFISKFWEEWNEVMRKALVTKLGWPNDGNSRMISDTDYTSFTADSCRRLANCTRNSSLPFDSGAMGRGGEERPRSEAC